MNPEIKARWVQALRSGEFKQGEGRLAIETIDGPTYCCLGVLCEIAVADSVIGRTGTAYGPYDDTAELPDAVAKWAGLNENNPTVLDSLANHISLAAMNDGDASTSQPGLTFAQIADVIEDQL